MWVRLNRSTEGILDIGLNTTDQTIHGIEYSGYFWAQTEHLSLFGIAGAEREPSTFRLKVGPVTGDDGEVLFDAAVRLEMNGAEFEERSGYFGLAHFLLMNGYIGSPVNVTVEKEGYETLNYQTWIMPTGELQHMPAPLNIVEEEENEEENVVLSFALFMVILAIIMIFVLGSVARSGRNRNRS